MITRPKIKTVSMNVAEKIHKQVQRLPEQTQAEVLEGICLRKPSASRLAKRTSNGRSSRWLLQCGESRKRRSLSIQKKISKGDSVRRERTWSDCSIPISPYGFGPNGARGTAGREGYISPSQSGASRASGGHAPSRRRTVTTWPRW